VNPERRLVLGLGNPIAGDDGIGSHLVQRLRDHPRLPSDIDIMEGGTDLLRLAPQLEQRPGVVLIDALLDPGEPGKLLRFQGDFRELDERGGSVHHLCPVQALRLLRCLYPPLREVPTTFLAVTVACARISHELSPALSRRLGALVEEVLDILEEEPAPVS
jgi:hydrogenase maturation protease